MEAQQHRPKGHVYEEEDEGELVVKGNKIGLRTALDDDPNAPKEEKEKSPSNYQTKVTDPTGANKEEVGSGLVESLEKMSVNEETKAEQEGKSSKASDRGVSMKKYLAEKFKPRDEDKALSEVISGKLSGRKNKPEGWKDKTEGTEQAEATTEKVEKPEGVATQKGSADEQRDVASTDSEGGGKSMIDRLKGATTSLWFRKGAAKAKPAAGTSTTTSTPVGS